MTSRDALRTRIIREKYAHLSDAELVYHHQILAAQIDYLRAQQQAGLLTEKQSEGFQKTVSHQLTQMKSEISRRGIDVSKVDLTGLIGGGGLHNVRH